MAKLPRTSLFSAISAISALYVSSFAIAADREPRVRNLLARAAEYVQAFEDDFSTVISTEIYEQHAEQRRESPKAWLTISSASRTLRSEMLLTRLPGRRTWLTVRNVLDVDGTPVEDSEKRLDRALAESSTRVLRALADEGARFNLGVIRRNVNDPTFALRFLERDAVSGFSFAVAGREPIGAGDAWKLTYKERQSPSLIHDARNQDLPATGAIWLSSDGIVVRTRVDITDKHAHLQATTTVDYARDPNVAMWVPLRMSESYVERVGPVEERVDCTATYSDFRRFETSGRIVSPR